MRFSAIIPTLNEAETVVPLITFLRENGGSALLEILVVDGGSSDGTPDIACAHGARVLRCPVKSRAAQMNLGALNAAGDVLYFVHADTRPPKSFAADIEYALRNGIDMGCFKYHFDSPRFCLKINAWFSRFNWLWCQGGDKTFFIHRHTFTALGGYNERYIIMEEYDFIRRARKRFRMQTLQQPATVSARKYRLNSWWSVQATNMLVFTLFRLGCPPNLLKRTYKRLIK